MKRIFLIGPIVALPKSCTTLDQSFMLGVFTGAFLTGEAATYAAHSAIGRNPSPEEVGLGATIGLGLGLITSYFVHEQIIEDRDEMSKQTEIYFGDSF